MAKRRTIDSKGLQVRLDARQREASDRAERADRAIVAALGGLQGELVRAIRDGANPGRLAAIIRRIYPDIKRAIGDHLAGVATWGYQQTVDALMDALPPEHVHAAYRLATAREATGPERDLGRLLFPPPTEEQVLNIIRRRSNAPDGLTWEQRLDRWSRKITDRDRLAASLAQGLSSGETIQQVERRVRAHVQGIRSSSMRIARTESMRVANDVGMEAYEDAGDIVRGYQIIATLDGATRPHHAARHGLIWRKGDDTPMATKLRMTSDSLPDEPNCRCYLSPILATDQEIETLRNTGPVRERFAPHDGTPEQHRAFQRWFDEQATGRRIAVVGLALWQQVSAAVGREPTWIDFVQFGQPRQPRRQRLVSFDERFRVQAARPTRAGRQPEERRRRRGR